MAGTPTLLDIVFHFIFKGLQSASIQFLMRIIRKHETIWFTSRVKPAITVNIKYESTETNACGLIS